MQGTEQLLLGLNLKAEEDFESFCSIRDAKLIISSFKQFIDDNEQDFVFLCGGKSSGKSHLLQAVCHYSSQNDKISRYIPLQQLVDIEPACVLDGHESVQFLCIDDMECIKGNSDWQEALFHLYNERQLKKLPLYFASNVPAVELILELKDLQSRMTACLSFQLPKLSDQEKAQMLQFRAQLLGMEIIEPNALYLLQHYSRDSADLMQALKVLDEQSLKKGRKITIPFIKSVFNA